MGDLARAERADLAPGSGDAPVVATGNQAIRAILTLITDPTIDLERMKAARDLYRECLADEGAARFAAAVAKFNAIKPRPKRAQANAYLSKAGVDRDGKRCPVPVMYADEHDLRSVCDPILGSLHLSVEYGDFVVEGDELHGSAWLTYGDDDGFKHNGTPKKFAVPILQPQTNDRGNEKVNALQRRGISWRYLRRFLYDMVLGLATESDMDGNDQDSFGGGAPEVITDEQVAEFNDLIIEYCGKKKKDVDQFKAWFCAKRNIASIADIPAEAFDRERNLLLSWIGSAG